MRSIDELKNSLFARKSTAYSVNFFSPGYTTKDDERTVFRVSLVSNRNFRVSKLFIKTICSFVRNSTECRELAGWRDKNSPPSSVHSSPSGAKEQRIYTPPPSPRDTSGDKLPSCKLWKWNFQAECDRPPAGSVRKWFRSPSRRSLLEQMAGTFFVIYSYSSISLVFFWFPLGLSLFLPFLLFPFFFLHPHIHICTHTRARSIPGIHALKGDCGCATTPEKISPALSLESGSSLRGYRISNMRLRLRSEYLDPLSRSNSPANQALCAANGESKWTNVPKLRGVCR